MRAMEEAEEQRAAVEMTTPRRTRRQNDHAQEEQGGRGAEQKMAIVEMTTPRRTGRQDDHAQEEQGGRGAVRQRWIWAAEVDSNLGGGEKGKNVLSYVFHLVGTSTTYISGVTVLPRSGLMAFSSGFHRVVRQSALTPILLLHIASQIHLLQDAASNDGKKPGLLLPGLCFLHSRFRLPAVLAAMPLDGAGLLGCAQLLLAELPAGDYWFHPKDPFAPTLLNYHYFETDAPRGC